MGDLIAQTKMVGRRVRAYQYSTPWCDPVRLTGVRKGERVAFFLIDADLSSMRPHPEENGPYPPTDGKPVFAAAHLLGSIDIWIWRRANTVTNIKLNVIRFREGREGGRFAVI